MDNDTARKFAEEARWYKDEGDQLQAAGDYVEAWKCYELAQGLSMIPVAERLFAKLSKVAIVEELASHI